MAWGVAILGNQFGRPTRGEDRMAARPLLLGFGVAIGASFLTAVAVTAQTAPATDYSLKVPAASANALSAPPSVQQIDVKVTLNKTETVSLATPFTEALIGNAAVADIVPLTDRSVYIVGKKVGVTRLTLLDQAKQPSSVVDVEVTYDLAVLRAQLKRLRGVQVTSVNGKILLTGMASDAVAMQQALLLAEQIAPGDVTNASSRCYSRCASSKPTAPPRERSASIASSRATRWSASLASRVRRGRSPAMQAAAW
jgi:Flp pilus assembly secretin CpaC